MIISLGLLHLWVMESFITNHYTAKAFCVLEFSIWGFGVFLDLLKHPIYSNKIYPHNNYTHHKARS